MTGGKKLDVDQQAITAASDTLRGAADDLGADLQHPPAIDAGPLTGMFLAAATRLVQETETLAGQLAGAGQAVASSRDQYSQVDEANRDALRPMEEKRRDWAETDKHLREKGVDPEYDGPV